jgi:hypothetical protein
VSATRVIQTAIYAVLSADATLLALAEGGVHNDVPDGQAYPHVLISRATEMPQHALGGPATGLGWRNIIRIHTYSRYQGDREAMLIDERICTLLNFQTLTVTGFASVIVAREQMRLLVEAIEKIETRHLVSEYAVTVQQ